MKHFYPPLKVFLEVKKKFGDKIVKSIVCCEDHKNSEYKHLHSFLYLEKKSIYLTKDSLISKFKTKIILVCMINKRNLKK